MTWLAPLGFLGLLSIIMLIIIYVIKPNYQKKMISSTFVWKLSLKYKKKRLPISRLNNILIFLCQLLILTVSALLLARPAIEYEKVGDENERIIIIDASASMRVNDGAATRFERAVEEARALVDETFEAGGVVSIILADTDPEYLVQRNGADKKEDVLTALADLAEGEKCTYSAADMTTAMSLTEEVLRYNTEAQIFLYTGTTYLEKNGVNVVNVAKAEEWNAAILDCKAEIGVNSNYEITIDVGCYNRDDEIRIFCEIYNINRGKEKLTIETSLYFDPTAEEQTIVLTENELGSLYAFEYLEVYVAVEDAFLDDNSFFLYGAKPVIKVQYASSSPNNYFIGVLNTLRQMFKDQWTIQVDTLAKDVSGKTEDYDLYIFEHRMPTVMPTDGVVLLVDPYGSPEGAGITFGSTLKTDYDPQNPEETTLAAGLDHVLTKYVDTSKISVTKYTEVVSADGYDELAYYNGKPVMLAKNEDDVKIVVWAFDLNYSNLSLRPDFAFLMHNMFNHYIPATVSSNAFEIGDTVELNARGTDLKVEGNGLNYAMEGKTGSIVVTHPGTYTITQTPMRGDELLIENFFVRIPEEQSNITRQVDVIPAADVDVETRIEFEDLMFYFAIALVSLLFIEWLLQIKKNF